MKIGILGLIFVVLLCAKLLGIGDAATMSWWWVFAPFFVWLALVVGILAAWVAAAIRN